jgi:putative endonuclease
VCQSSRELGTRGEDIAIEHLESLGFYVVSRNFRTRFGEIDLIARDGDTIVFVEVKARRSRQFGRAVEQITKGKQRKIVKTAGEYLRRSGSLESCVRFDVLAIDILPGGEVRIEHVKGAFNGWR